MNKINKKTDKIKLICEDLDNSAVEVGIALGEEVAGALPIVSSVWKFLNVYRNAQLKLRYQRAVEWVEFIQANPSIFVEELMKDESFQDGLLLTVDKYLIERSETKRKMIQNIFLGFSPQNNKETFEIEKLLNVLNLVSLDDIEVLTIWEDGSIRNWFRSEFRGASKEDIDNMMINSLNMERIFTVIKLRGGTLATKDKRYVYEKFNYLAGVGLFIPNSSTTYNGMSGYTISQFGLDFIKYINK